MHYLFELFRFFGVLFSIFPFCDGLFDLFPKSNVATVIFYHAW